MRRMALHLLIFSMLLAGCGKPAEEKPPVVEQKIEKSESVKNENVKSQEPSSEKAASGFSPFYVYKDKGSRENHFIPSGFMPDGKCLSLNDAWQEQCHD